MSSVRSLYCREIRRRLENLFASWLPDETRRIGDYGYLNRDRSFEYVGNLCDAGWIEPSIAHRPVENVELRSVKGRNVRGGARGAAPAPVAGKAHATLRLDERDSVYLSVVGGTQEQLSDLVEVERRIKQLRADGRWKDEYVLVTQRRLAGGGIAVATETGDALLEVHGGGADPGGLLWGEADLKIVPVRGVSFWTQIPEGATPLVALARLRRRLFGSELRLASEDDMQSPDAAPRDSDDLYKLEELGGFGSDDFSDEEGDEESYSEAS